VVHEPGETEVAQARAQVAVQQDVAGLDVPVDDALLALLVEVRQHGRDAGGHRVSLRPRQRAGLAVEGLVQAAVGHVLVHQQQLALLVAPPLELDEVLVPEAGDDGELGDELAPALVRLRRPLNGVGGGGSSRHGGLVHSPERALADDPARVESSGGRAQLLVAELPRALEQLGRESGVVPGGELYELLDGDPGEEHEGDGERDGTEDSEREPDPLVAVGGVGDWHGGRL